MNFIIKYSPTTMSCICTWLIIYLFHLFIYLLFLLLYNSNCVPRSFSNYILQYINLYFFCYTTDAEYLDILSRAYPNALDREKRHIEAFRAQIEGNVPKSSELYDQITIKYPRGIISLSFLFIICSYQIFKLSDLHLAII